MTVSYAFSQLEYTQSSEVLHVAVALSVKKAHLFEGSDFQNRSSCTEGPN